MRGRAKGESARAAFVARIGGAPGGGGIQFNPRFDDAVGIHARDAVGAERGDEHFESTGGKGNGHGHRERVRERGEVRKIREGEAGVQIKIRHRATADGDPGEAVGHKIPAQRRLETDEVARLAVGHVEITGDGIDGETEIDRADARKVARDRESVGVEFHDIVVGHGVVDDRRVVAWVAGIDDERDLWWGRQSVRRCGLRRRVRGRDERGVISGKRERGIDVGAVGTDGERAGIFAEDGDVGDARVRGEIEDGDLIFARGGDEGPARREDHVRRFVRHVNGVGHDMARDGDDADAVGNFVDHPGLVVVARIDRDGFEADGNFRDENGVRRIGNIENGEAVVRRVDGEEARAVGRETDGAGLLALVIDVGILREGGRSQTGREKSEDAGEPRGERAPVAGRKAN